MNELCHHGVKGMRWGVRRKLRKLEKKQLKRLRKNNSFNAKTKVKKMSDQELVKRLQRVNLEKQYLSAIKDLDPEPKKLIRQAVYDSSKKQLTNVLNYLGGTFINALSNQEISNTGRRKKKKD